MKSPLLIALGLVTIFISQNSNAMAKRPYIDSEILHEVEVEQSFQVTAKDGSKVSFQKYQQELAPTITFSLDKKKGNFLILKARNKEIPFKILGSVENIKEITDLNKLQILQNSSGQGLGIKFRITDTRHSMGEDKEYTESCSIDKTVRRCRDDYEYDKETNRRRYRGEVCETITISEPGIRDVQKTEFTTVTEVEMEIIDSSLRTVLSAQISDYRTWGPESKGLCMSR
ncbi:hypothetical protein ACLVWU_07525 [Bdellovibrio sp. HCB290]|uniref:hypothetical protein n=1 Tax=Bdellovibrio sp. HCB290 TaxID=3394356 RepID=UPI0039B3F9C9